MRLRKIQLKNFRNFPEKEFYFNPFITFILGENSVGKTNLLEAIHLLCNGEGLKEKKIEELILFDKEMAYIDGTFSEKEDIFNYRVVITRGSRKKTFSIDGAKTSLKGYLPKLPTTVVFTPAQIKIITGSPEKRRNYIDSILSKSDLDYKKALLNYKNALYRRNKILEESRITQWNDKKIIFWNDFLIKNGSYIQERREKYVKYLNTNASLNAHLFHIEYNKNPISSSALQGSFQKEMIFKKTLVGPQRDEFVFFIEKEGRKLVVQDFGSRSEQRLTLLYLKLRETKYLDETTNFKPILLLDDIFSELDNKNKLLVLSLLSEYQSIITTTDPLLIEELKFPKDVILLKK